MTFLQPWAAWFLAGIPIIVALYLLRLKRRDLTVSTHLFWQRVLQESSRRAFFQRLRNVLSLLLHLLIFLLIALALARPLWRNRAATAELTVVVLDTRARMQAVESDGVTRFAKAQLLARDYLRRANARAEFALIATDHAPRVVVPFTDDERALNAGLNQTQVTDASGDIAAAIGLANSILAGRGQRGEVVIITDRAFDIPPADGEPPRTLKTVGSRRDNLAITRFTARANPMSPETAEVLLEVSNFTTAPVKTDVELSLDGRAFEVRPVALAAGEIKVDTFASLPRSGRGARGWLTAKLKATDALPADDIAYAVLPMRPPRRVLLVTSGNPFLEKLLSVTPGTKFQLIEPAAWQASLAPKFEVIVFDRILPPGFDWKAAVGNYLIIGTDPFGGKAGVLDRPLVTQSAMNHPATRAVNLQNVGIQRAVQITVPLEQDGWHFESPLQSFDHPLLLLGDGAKRRLAVLAFDVMESDLPLRVAFPLLIGNVLDWLDTREASAPLNMLAGESTPLAPGAGASATPLFSIPKTALTLAPAAIFAPLRNGFYAIGTTADPRWAAVNTFSAAESDLRQGAASAPAQSSAPRSAALAAWPLWSWLACAALGLFTAEWFLFHRRKTE